MTFVSRTISLAALLTALVVPVLSQQGGAGVARTGPAQRGASPTEAELPMAIEKLFDVRVRADEFSGVVLVAKDGVPIVAKAYGLADRDKQIANKLDTKINLGSINKMFTRIAIGQLVKEGKLSFNDKLIKILPDYPNRDAADKITIGHLVTMRSGIGDIFNERYEAMDPHRLRSLQDYFALFADKPLEFEPGTKNKYSNGGYIVLGSVIERLTGKSYYEYVREIIFEPLAMMDTAWHSIDKLPVNTAIGYTRKGATRVQNTPMMPGRGSSAGGGYSTAPDLLKFAAALRSGKIAIPNDDGTFPTEFTGAGIAGGADGINGIFTTNAKTGYTIIILSNFDPPSAEQPVGIIRDWIRQITQK